MERFMLVVFLSLCSSEMPAEVRLVDRCSGTLEAKEQGNWTAVVTSDLNSSLKKAVAVCRQLDCGSVVSLRRTPVTPEGTEVVVDFLVSSFGTSYLNPFKVEINCSDFVRLVNGRSLCSGRLEVKSYQFWSPVSEDGFDLQDAEVVCRELGCGAPLDLQGALFGETDTPTWSAEFQCEGHESSFWDCSSAARKMHSGRAVRLTCSETSTIRLVGGDGRCGGTVEMKQGGEWKPAYSDYWTLKFAGEVCKQLECGAAISTRSRKTSSRFVWGLNLNCDDTNMMKCFDRITYSSHSVEVTCSDLPVRLVSGTNSCSGRLEVKSNQSWSSVCEEDFDMKDAEVVCRELGCGAPLVLQGALFGAAGAPTWSKAFQCDGHESALRDCGSSRVMRKTCRSAVGLDCSDPDDVRLVGGASRCAGKVQVKHDGSWENVLNLDSEWNAKTTEAICQRLDCGSSISKRTAHEDQRPSRWIQSSCIEKKSSMKDCVTVKDTHNTLSVEITCSDAVRLVNGRTPCSGRLQVKSDQSWSSMCELDFDQPDAEVVCRELGCGPPSVVQGVRYDETQPPVWSKEFLCEGNESALTSCDSTRTARNTCSLGNVAELTCSDNVRLVGEASRCAGTLDMFNQVEWRPVVECKYNWDQKSAAAVCLQLGCGIVVSTGMRVEPLVRPVWCINSLCMESSLMLQPCVDAADDVESEYSLHIVCSDLLARPQVSLHSSTNGVSEAKTQGSQLLIGSEFGILCSIKPQYEGGSFQLIFNTSNTSVSYTMPAVNHSALFLFSVADHAHQGAYSCVYHIAVYAHNFSSESEPLRLSVMASLTELMVRLVVLLAGMASLLVTCFYFQVSGKETRHEAGRKQDEVS